MFPDGSMESLYINGLMAFFKILMVPKPAYTPKVGLENGKKRSPRLLDFQGFQGFGGISRTRTYDPHDVNCKMEHIR